jgi:hypothetical protein
MARLVRVSPVDIPQHIIHRENNRQVCFGKVQVGNKTQIQLILYRFNPSI